MPAHSDLVGGIAHEFNNLLGIIIGNLDLAVRRKVAVGVEKEPLDAALATALRAAEFTTDLLAIAGRLPLLPVATDLNQVAKRVGRSLQQAFSDGAEIFVEPAATIADVWIDAARLEASLIALGRQWLGVTANHGRLLISTASCSANENFASGALGPSSGRFAHIEMRNPALHLPHAELDRLFAPFQAASGGPRTSGLGLSPAAGLAIQSGGYLDASSDEATGTVFRIYLPCIDKCAEPALEEHPAPRQSCGTETVLIVEDSAFLRNVARLQLSELGCRILEAHDAKQAIAILERGGVDLVFTDIVMPGNLNGRDLAQLVSQRWPHVRMILTSGTLGQIGEENRTAQTKTRYLRKPYRKAELLAAVNNALRHQAISSLD